MTTVLDSIPEYLQREVSIALAWFNAREKAEFEVTGIVDPPSSGEAVQTLRLVLCGAGICRQETFRVDNSPNGPEIEWLGNDASKSGEETAELDPPPGARRGWLDDVSARHKFVVLLFYRGFW